MMTPLRPLWVSGSSLTIGEVDEDTTTTQPQSPLSTLVKMATTPESSASVPAIESVPMREVHQSVPVREIPEPVPVPKLSPKPAPESSPAHEPIDNIFFAICPRA